MMDFEQVVPLKEIENSLSKILDDLQGKNKTRACLFNLLIYTKENTREKYIQTVLKKIVERFPCRIILFVDKGKEPFELKSTISVIGIKQGESQVFCDCIQFELSSCELSKIPFLSLPHLMTDLPTYLLFAEDPLKQDPYIFNFEKFCSRIIFDSEVSDNIPSFAKSILKYCTKTGTEIADLNWARTESFRDLLTSLFFRIKKSKTMKTITITYNQTPSNFFCHTKIQAIYLSMWFAIQMDLKLQSTHPDHLNFLNGDQQITIRLQQGSHPEVTAGRILAIEIDLENEEHYLLKRKEKANNIVIIYRSEKEFCEIPSEYLLAAEDSGASLVEEILHQGTSKSFLKVLNFIAHQPVEEFCL